MLAYYWENISSFVSFNIRCRIVLFHTRRSFMEQHFILHATLSSSSAFPGRLVIHRLPAWRIDTIWNLSSNNHTRTLERWWSFVVNSNWNLQFGKLGVSTVAADALNASPLVLWSLTLKPRILDETHAESSIDFSLTRRKIKRVVSFKSIVFIGFLENVDTRRFVIDRVGKISDNAKEKHLSDT